jgi:hypothetical protein
MLEQSLFFIVLLSIFIAGILFDKYILNNNIQDYYKPESFFTKQRNSDKVYKNNIEIDDKKIVMGVETVNMESKHDGLGKTTESKDNTQSAINKLKSMKGK